jgi:hypothetical protein
VPGPGSVEVKGEFQKGSVRPKAFSFGLAREYFKKVYFKEGATVDPVVPGPGRYSLTTCIGNDAKPVTIKGRNMKERSQSKNILYSFLSAERNAFIPGPGKYQPKVEMDGQGVYFVSNLKSS